MKQLIDTIFLTEISDIDSLSALKGIDNKYHYFYKIVNKKNGNYYFGIHTTKNIYDNYLGSGKLLQLSYKKHGIENFTKYIISFFNTRKDLLNHEKHVVTKEICKDTKCYNIVQGGMGPDSIYIVVRDTNNKNITITRDEFIKNSHLYTHHSKGRTIINNGVLHKYIYPNELDKYLNEGWVRGELIHSTANKVIVNKNNIEKFIKLDELDKYLNEGWVRGGKTRNKGTASHAKGKIWINNGIIQQRISKLDLDTYITEGWNIGICQKTTKGYVKLTDGVNNISIDPNNVEQIKFYIDQNWKYGITRNEKQKVWINNGLESKMILVKNINEYELKGWKKGRLKHNLRSGTKNKIAIHQENKTKFVSDSELDKYLNDGWSLGNSNKHKNTNSNKKVIHQENKTKFVSDSELDKYLNDGWSLGKHIKNTQKGRIRVNNGQEERLIELEDFENNYNKNIWKRGLIKPRKCKKVN